MYQKDPNNKEDGLEFFEFREIAMDKVLARDPAAERRRAFDLFDKDGSGTISLRDLRLLARQIGEECDDDTFASQKDLCSRPYPSRRGPRRRRRRRVS